MRYFGIDLHKEYAHVFEWSPDNEEGRHFRLPNTPSAWEVFRKDLGPDSQVAFEVTGNAFQVHDLLSASPARILLANPHELKRLGMGRHTDRVDAERLAKMLALGTLKPVWVPPQEMREVRKLLKAREGLVRAQNRSINQARAILREQGYWIPRDVDVRRWLQSHPFRVPAASQIVLLESLRFYASLEEAVGRLEAEIARRTAHVETVRLLMTIPGVSLVVAAAIWCILGDPKRFRSPKQVARYVGLDPSVDQSGERDRRGRISKHGSSLLRKLLVQAAWSTARFDAGALGAFHARKRKGLTSTQATVAVARKLIIIAWRIMLTGEPYRAQKPQTTARKLREAEKASLRPAEDVVGALAGLLSEKEKPTKNLRSHERPTRKPEGRRKMQTKVPA